MRSIFSKNTYYMDNQLVGIEDILNRIMVPITPRPEFLFDLKTTLLTYDHKSKPSTANLVLMFIASFISFVMVLVMGLRSLLVIISAIGAIRHYRKEIQAKQLIPFQQN